jgi:hypothetical protein
VRLSRSAGRDLLFWGFLVILSVWGAWISLKYTCAAWGIDPDVAETVVLVDGYAQHGWKFLATFHYTQDNWLLSLVPLSALVFLIVGTKATAVILLGWLIFMASAILAAAICSEITDNRRAWLILPFCLMANQAAIGSTGFLAQPVSHNVTAMYCLFYVYAMILWIKRRWWIMLALGMIAFVLAGLSDPWAMAAFGLPAVLAALVAWLARPSREASRIFLPVLLIACVQLVIVRTKAFGLLGFLPPSFLHLTDWDGVNSNFVWITAAFANIFNPFPGLGAPRALTTTVICGLTLMILWWASRRLFRFRHKLGPQLRFVGPLALLSLTVPVAAFIVSDFSRSLMVGRFLIAAYFFLPVIVGAALTLRSEDHIPMVRAGAAVLAALVMTSSVISNAQAWRDQHFAISAQDILGWIGFLRAHDLHFGYGPYWGSEANVVAWISKGQVTVRPIQFDSRTGFVAPRWGQTSPLWYQKSNVPVLPSYFVVLTNDGENCPDFSVCLAGVQKQFGPAQEVLSYEGRTVLVWNHPLNVPPGS